MLAVCSDMDDVGVALRVWKLSRDGVVVDEIVVSVFMSTLPPSWARETDNYISQLAESIRSHVSQGGLPIRSVQVPLFGGAHFHSGPTV